MKVVQFAQFPVLINELDDPAGDPGPRVSGLLALLSLVSLPPAEVVLPGVDHDGAAFHVPGPAVPEADHGVVDVDEGDGEVGVGEDVAQVTSVSHGGVGARVIILKWQTMNKEDQRIQQVHHVGVEVSAGSLTGVPGVACHVDVEAVEAGGQAHHLAEEDHALAVAAELQAPRHIGAPRDQVDN